MRVGVYYNLHKKCLSVKSLEGPSYGKVIHHRKSVKIKSAMFVVNEAGRKKVIKEKKKNVHAYVRGFIVNSFSKKKLKQVRVTYNPYKYNTFIEIQTQNPIYSAKYVEINDTNITAYI